MTGVWYLELILKVYLRMQIIKVLHIFKILHIPKIDVHAGKEASSVSPNMTLLWQAGGACTNMIDPVWARVCSFPPLVAANDQVFSPGHL